MRFSWGLKVSECHDEDDKLMALKCHLTNFTKSFTLNKMSNSSKYEKHVKKISTH